MINIKILCEMKKKLCAINIYIAGGKKIYKVGNKEKQDTVNYTKPFSYANTATKEISHASILRCKNITN